MQQIAFAPLALVAVAGLSSFGQASADITDFNTSLTQLSGSAFQLDQNFSILYNLDVVHVDLDNDNVPDQDIVFGAGDYLGDYLDPEHYVLDFGVPGSGFLGNESEIRPFFLGNELTSASNVDWRLSYVSTPGDESTIYSTIMSGSAQSIAGGLRLNITDGLEWPVNGWSIPDVGLPLGTHWAADIADFDSLTFSYSGNLSANVVPAPGVLALLAVGGLAGRRRRL